MHCNIFKIVYQKPSFLGFKEKVVIARDDEAAVLIQKCHRRNYPIITIQHI